MAAAEAEGAEELKTVRSSVPVGPTQRQSRGREPVSKSAPPPPVPLRLTLSEPSHDKFDPGKDVKGMLDTLGNEVVQAMKACVSGCGAGDDIREQWDACARWAAAAPHDRAHCGCVDKNFRVVALAALRLYTVPAPRGARDCAVYAVLNRFLREKTQLAAADAAAAPDAAQPLNVFAPWNNYLWFLLLAIRSIRFGVFESSSGKEEMPEEVPEKLYHGTVMEEASYLNTEGRGKIFRGVTSASADETTASRFGSGCVVVLHGARGSRLCGVAPVSAVRCEREYLFEPMTLFDPPFDSPPTPLRTPARHVGMPVETVLIERERGYQRYWLLDWNETFMGSLTLS